MATATLRIQIPMTGITKAQLVNFEGSRDVAELVDKIRGLCNENTAVAGTATTASVSVLENGTQASATVTCVTVGNNATVTLGNVVLTGKTSGASGQAQWVCGVSASADATALKACINAHTTLSTWFLASSLSGVVTITALDYDTRGNAYGLASSDGTNLAVVGFASGAADASSITVNV